MSAQDLASAAYSAGFRGDALVDAIAVGLAESSGDPNAHCLNCGGVTEDSRGLWQINVLAHPQYRDVNLYDPTINAQAAYAVSSSGTNFGPWSTWTGGQYRTHLTEAQDAAASVGLSPPASSSPAPANGAPAGSSIPPVGAPSSRWIVGGLIAAAIAVVLID